MNTVGKSPVEGEAKRTDGGRLEKCSSLNNNEMVLSTYMVTAIAVEET